MNKVINLLLLLFIVSSCISCKEVKRNFLVVRGKIAYETPLGIRVSLKDSDAAFNSTEQDYLYYFAKEETELNYHNGTLDMLRRYATDINAYIRRYVMKDYPEIKDLYINIIATTVEK